MRTTFESLVRPTNNIFENIPWLEDTTAQVWISDLIPTQIGSFWKYRVVVDSAYSDYDMLINPSDTQWFHEKGTKSIIEYEVISNTTIDSETIGVIYTLKQTDTTFILSELSKGQHGDLYSCKIDTVPDSGVVVTDTITIRNDTLQSYNTGHLYSFPWYQYRNRFMSSLSNQDNGLDRRIVAVDSVGLYENARASTYYGITSRFENHIGLTNRQFTSIYGPYGTGIHFNIALIEHVVPEN